MSGYTADTFEHNRLNVEIWYDDMADDPLTWASAEERGVWYVLKHNRYNLPFEIDADLDDYSSWTELAEAVTAKGGELEGKVYRFMRWYEHSGIAVSLRDDESGHDWDAGIAGVVFADTTDQINADFQSYAAYIQGDVYGYTITNPKNGEVVDSCGGFYGDDDVTTAAKEAADAFTHPHEAAYAKNAGRYHA